jgi:glutamyl-tRNA reductase
MRLAVIHRPRVGERPPLSGTVWSTCLREVAFLSEIGSHSAGQVISGEDAYALLLEIVCGLQSPLVGETEVQAQFKAFLASLDHAAHGWLLQLGQRLLADAKAIRHQHLQGVAVGSYGHLALRHARGVRLAIVGAGALAQDILDHAAPGRAIDVWRRRQSGQRLRDERLVCDYLALDDAGDVPQRQGSTSLIVAAPADGFVLERVAACYPQLTDVVDLRARDDVTAVSRAVPCTTLAEMLSGASDGRPEAVASALAAVRERASAFTHARQVRPFGWDDLCA